MDEGLTLFTYRFEELEELNGLTGIPTGETVMGVNDAGWLTNKKVEDPIFQIHQIVYDPVNESWVMVYS